MKIALIGYGNMGKEIEKSVLESGIHEIVSISRKSGEGGLDIKGIREADVAIDFTSGEAVVDTVRQVAPLRVNMVVGTTDWHEKISEVEKLVKENEIGLVHGKNFSIGANVFFKIAAFGSKLFSQFENYDVFGYEIHHKGKKDSPSGTAKQLANVVMKNFPAKKTVQDGKLDRRIRDDELHFASIRGGQNRGFHEIFFDSPADEISISHQAHSREGFADGAIMAAELIEGKKGFHTFEELFDTKYLQ